MKEPWQNGLYLVTHRGTLSEKRFLEIIEAAIAGGVSIVQLREKLNEPGITYKIGKALVAMLNAHHIPLIVNDSIDLAKAICAEGVHLGQSDTPIQEARHKLGSGAILGLSLNSIDDASTTEAGLADYLAASPVFNSSTKLDTTEPFGLDGLRAVREHVPETKPLFAIGGITLDNAADVLDAGASGLAVVSAIFSSKSPQDAAQTLNDLIQRHHAKKQTL